MPDLPVMLKVHGRRCVIVGGGSVALRRAKALREAGARVCVVAPTIADHVQQALTEYGVEILARGYQPADLAGAMLVVVATDDSAVNEQVAADGQRQGVLVNRADDPEAGDLNVPAHAHHGPVTLAVYTGGASAQAAAAIRRQLSAALDPHWLTLLELLLPLRKQLQAQIADDQARLQLLTKLGGEEALAALKAHGRPGLEEYWKKCIQEGTGT